jgi:hypothetical protein
VAASRSGQVSMRRLIGGLALTPLELFAIIRLARRYRAARRSLSAVASAGFPVPCAAGIAGGPVA